MNVYPSLEENSVKFEIRELIKEEKKIAKIKFPICSQASWIMPYYSFDGGDRKKSHLVAL